ncbi:uncharacterized protein CYBJADRAFT_61656 [Cyberlindnera jadinii NRRL Y-1542]|uniref:Uncharacterized protein n=1 Tax=Cyberlindnera jadinii (strain ATCC 18201 / CBS 1600 / BCRC 20928 / JCM 3617 / NBRC 0987 / NRRL Y-1542) TaxID=983966 RepID=A0A1E4S5K0_CYBJN|nr:hypothetical protein CYBJADRAFT_61656 [Cyberlindnera jadinii NRRL Y-1542]ODV74771.1 hypothetical protein CYBJADRAFT_61656 [Cyberlindnera jadinii NRRL Y-1542]
MPHCLWLAYRTFHCASCKLFVHRNINGARNTLIKCRISVRHTHGVCSCSDKEITISVLFLRSTEGYDHEWQPYLTLKAHNPLCIRIIQFYMSTVSVKLPIPKKYTTYT